MGLVRQCHQRREKCRTSKAKAILAQRAERANYPRTPSAKTSHLSWVSWLLLESYIKLRHIAYPARLSAYPMSLALSFQGAKAICTMFFPWMHEPMSCPRIWFQRVDTHSIPPASLEDLSILWHGDNNGILKLTWWACRPQPRREDTHAA